MKTPWREFTGRRLEVEFLGGIGRTRSVKKARQFSEVFGYEVTLPPEIAPWTETPENIMASRGEEYEREDTINVVSEVE